MSKKEIIIETLLYSLVGIIFTLIIAYAFLRADRICQQANINDYNGYRFCMGI